MFTTEDIKNLQSRRARLLMPAIAVGLLLVFAYWGVLVQFQETCMRFAEGRFGKSAAEATPAILILPSFVLFLVPVVWAERKAKLYSLKCPDCAYDLSRLSVFVTTTKCCSNCGGQIVDGKLRTVAVFKRFTEMRSRRFLVIWFWAWPALGLAVLTCYWLKPDLLENCLQMLVIPAVIGTIATGWTFLRTRDGRYLPQAFASTVMLIVNGLIFWKAL
ncbi:MAG: hypothetical protein SFV81_16995 [Pirellulaceae bacterium]|nr:hypothetical protein [Pirellulaceae bacterium]